jgi:hypothetical protein
MGGATERRQRPEENCTKRRGGERRTGGRRKRRTGGRERQSHMLALSRDPPSRRPQLQTPKKIRDFQLVPALDVAQTRQRRRRSPKAEGGFWDVPHDGEVCCACAFSHLLSYPVPRAALLADHRLCPPAPPAPSRLITSPHLTSLVASPANPLASDRARKRHGRRRHQQRGRGWRRRKQRGRGPDIYRRSVRLTSPSL